MLIVRFFKNNFTLNTQRKTFYHAYKIKLKSSA